MEILKKKKKKGFTLIELLVVIAIIGILASIVLVSVNSARNRAKDAAIKGSMESIRTEAELSYDTDSDYSAICHATDGTLADTGNYTKIETSVTNQNGGSVFCQTCSSASAYEAHSVLAASTDSWCVDSEGFSGKILSTALPAAGDCTCD